MSFVRTYFTEEASGDPLNQLSLAAGTYYAFVELPIDEGVYAVSLEVSAVLDDALAIAGRSNPEAQFKVDFVETPVGITSPAAAFANYNLPNMESFYLKLNGKSRAAFTSCVKPVVSRSIALRIQVPFEYYVYLSAVTQ